MPYDAACDHVCHAIAALLFSLSPPTRSAAYAAARATRDVAAALHHDAGNPSSSRWRDAIASLERFLSYSKQSPKSRDMNALRELRSFVEENSDLLAAA
jgi:hypothetical protein